MHGLACMLAERPAKDVDGGTFPQTTVLNIFTLGIWVTPTPNHQDLCQSYDSHRVLIQVLGLASFPKCQEVQLWNHDVVGVAKVRGTILGGPIIRTTV